MLKFCLNQWDKNKDKLESALREYERFTENSSLKIRHWNDVTYFDLVKLVVDNILNDEGNVLREWDSKRIHEINDGSYQGTLMYLIPENSYQPCEWEYLITYVGYGSCSYCDTLEHILCLDDEEYLTDRQIKDLMILCKDIVTNIRKPYNCGWREEEDFKEVEYRED